MNASHYASKAVLRLVAVIGLLVLSVCSMRAQGAVDGGGTLVTVRGAYSPAGANPSLTVTYFTEGDGENDLVLEATPATSNTAQRAIVLPVAKVVTFSVHAENVQNYNVSFAVPRGYQVYINGIAREAWAGSPGGGVDTPVLEVTIVRLERPYAPPNGAANGLPGDASSITVSAPASSFGPPSIPWIDFNLGNTLSGEPLPPLHLLLRNWDRTEDFYPWTAALAFEQYEGAHPDVDLEYPATGIMRLLAPQVTVDFVSTGASNAAGNFDLKFYRPGYSDPFAVYNVVFETFLVGVSTRYKGVTITKTASGAISTTNLRCEDTPTTPGIPYTPQWNDVRIYGSWKLQDWHRSGSTPRWVRVARSAADQNLRNSVVTETISVNGDANGNSVATQKTVNYSMATLQYTEPGSSSYNAYVHAPSQVTSGTAAGGGQFVSQILLDAKNRPVGNAEPSGYTAISEYIGSGLSLRPIRIARSWLDHIPTFSSTTGTITPNGAETINYLYAEDWTGATVLPKSIRRRQGTSQTLVAESTIVYTDETVLVPGSSSATYPILTATRYDFSAAGAYSSSPTERPETDGPRLKSILKTYRADTSNRILRNRPHALERPDGTKMSFLYESGDYSGGTFSVPGSTGKDLRITVYHGGASGGTQISSVASGPATAAIDPVRLVPLKSTKTVDILQRGLVVRRETYAFTQMSGAVASFELMGWENFSYADNGELLARTTSGNASYSVEWNADRSQQTITDETGATVTVVYDDAGRAATITRQGLSTVDQRVTTMEYDADHRVTKVKEGPVAGEQLITERQYTKAGLLDQVIEPGSVVTKYDYPSGTRDVKVTYHYGTTKSSERLVTRHAGGQTLSVTGSAVVEEHYGYDFASGLRRTTRRLGPVPTGATEAKRPRITVFDLLGRVVQEQTNGSGSTGSAKPLIQHFGYNSAGQLSERYTEQGGASAIALSARHVMKYDEMGMLTATGLNLGGTAELEENSTDRYESFTRAFYKDTSNIWWLRSTSNLYHSDNQSLSHEAVSQVRLGQLPAGMLAQSTATDYQGNSSSETVYFYNSSIAKDRRVVSVGSDGASFERILVHDVLTHERWFADTDPLRTGTPALSTTYHYDAQGRMSKAVDGRTGGVPSISYHWGTPRPWKIKDPRGTLVATHTYDAAGRLASTVSPVSTVDYFYTARGELEEESGSGAYPTKRTYTDFGELKELKTYRAGLSGDADVTAWTYDDNTGWLTKKTDAASRDTVYSYSFDDGYRDVLQTWVRNAPNAPSVKHRYSLSTGDLMATQHAGQATASGTDTTDIAYTYTRTGQVKTVTDAAGLRTFFYDKEQVKSEYLSSWYGNRAVTPNYQTATSTSANTVKGRYAGYKLGVYTSAPNADLTGLDQDKETAVTYSHDDLGRIGGLTVDYKAQGARSALSVPSTYRYKGGSSMWDKLTQGNYASERAFEANRDVILSITGAHTTGGTIATFGYSTDDAGRREWATQSGMAFGDFVDSSSDATYYRYNYDEKGQLADHPSNGTKAAQGYRGTNPAATVSPLPGRGFGYTYDEAGNRKTAGVSGDSVNYRSGSGVGDAIGANNLNQSLSRGTLKTRVSGTTNKDATVTVGGQSVTRETTPGRYWDVALSAYSQNAALTVEALLSGQTTQTGTVKAMTRPAHEVIEYDEDGNLKKDAQWVYEWDAQNRLRRMSRNPANTWGAPNRELLFTYDYAGRRIRKEAWENNVKSFDRKFIYEGWNLVAEIDAVSGKVVRSYAWGLDTASSLTATGGVGALVLQTVHTDATLTSYHVASDAGGNVAALVKRNPGQADDGAVAAVYEYGPFGEVVRAQAFDPNLTYQPFRFSTKYTDAESGLLYYGLRYYDPSQGRFINRDPIGEAGGVNLYGFVGNGPVNRIDVLGLQDVTHPNERPPEDYFPPPPSSRVYIPIITFGGPSYEPAIKDGANRVLEENRRGPTNAPNRVDPIDYDNPNAYTEAVTAHDPYAIMSGYHLAGYQEAWLDAHMSDAWKRAREQEIVGEVVQFALEWYAAGKLVKYTFRFVRFLWRGPNVVAAQAPGAAIEGTLTGSLKGLTPAERQFIAEARRLGLNVEVIARGSGKTADFLINGVKTELKTLTSAGRNTVKNAIQEAAKQAKDGQIFIDARNVNISAQEALRQIGVAQHNIGGLANRVMVLTSEGVVFF